MKSKKTGIIVEISIKLDRLKFIIYKNYLVICFMNII